LTPAMFADVLVAHASIVTDRLLLRCAHRQFASINH